MTKQNIIKYPPISERVPRMLHGADYNPEQWQHYPEVLAEDIRLMKLAKCNVMSVGIFSWVSLEPEEGVFTFEWMDRILDSFAENGIYAFWPLLVEQDQPGCHKNILRCCVWRLTVSVICTGFAIITVLHRLFTGKKYVS